MTNEDIFNQFLVDLNKGPRRALNKSFRQYAILRDELIETYSKLTGIDQDQFHDAIAMEMAKQMYNF